MTQVQKTRNTNLQDVETVTINVPLPQPLHHKLRVKAANDGTSLKQSVIDAITEWTKRR